MSCHALASPTPDAIVAEFSGKIAVMAVPASSNAKRCKGEWMERIEQQADSSAGGGGMLAILLGERVAGTEHEQDHGWSWHGPTRTARNRPARSQASIITSTRSTARTATSTLTEYGAAGAAAPLQLNHRSKPSCGCRSAVRVGDGFARARRGRIRRRGLEYS